jgi:molybdenum cofactor synthesis domain-containing protein
LTSTQRAGTASPKNGCRNTVGVVVIGDEVLSQKVQDANTPAILAAMAANGIDVGEVAMLPDVPARIAAVVADFAARFDFVVTTGGVGPTHDDCTWASVADALDEPIELHQEMYERMLQRISTGVSEQQKRMAMLPRGTQIADESGAYLFWCHNVYVMPGIPSMVRSAIDSVAQRYGAALRGLATVYFSRDEWDSVAQVDAIVAAFPDVTVGSYPVVHRDDHRHRVTLEGDDVVRLREAAVALIDDIGHTHHVRTAWRGASKQTRGSEQTRGIDSAPAADGS